MSVSVINPFVKPEEARRYQEFRPVYHHLPFEEVRREVGRKLERALDMACGTGHSTEALAAICGSVVGCDLSSAMLQEARQRLPGIRFVESSAEQTLLEEQSFEFINISMGVHWL